MLFVKSWICKESKRFSLFLPHNYIDVLSSCSLNNGSVKDDNGTEEISIYLTILLFFKFYKRGSSVIALSSLLKTEKSKALRKTIEDITSKILEYCVIFMNECLQYVASAFSLIDWFRVSFHKSNCDKLLGGYQTNLPPKIKLDVRQNLQRWWKRYIRSHLNFKEEEKNVG